MTAETRYQEEHDVTQDVRALRRSPAQGLAAEMAAATSPQVGLREVPYAVMTAVRVAPGTGAAARVEQVLGCPLPAGVGETTSAGDTHVLWLGPDEVLTWSPDGSVDPVAAAQALAAGVGTDRGQAVDVSSNRTTLELSGPRAASVLAKCVSMDLHDTAWPVGRAHATLVAGIPAVLWRVTADTYRVLPRSSFAEHLVRWLLDGMAEFADPAGEPLWR